MKILFLTSAHNSLSQRLFTELTERGHTLAVALATSEEAMVTAVAQQEPDVIIKGSISTLLNCINCIEYESVSH
jgi:putative two-component system protein, hydrogenase maturation factor HypX/HoxX